MWLNLSISGSDYVAWVDSFFGSTNAALILPHYRITAYDSPGYALSALMSDYLFVCPTRLLLQQTTLFRANSVSLHHWQFTHLPSWITCPGIFCRQLPLRVAHFSEAAFVFGTSYVALGAPGMTSEEEALSYTMRQFWVSFASTGVAVALASSWPTWTSASETYVDFNLNLAVRSQLKLQECRFWNEFGRLAEHPSLPGSSSPLWIKLIASISLIGVALVVTFCYCYRRKQHQLSADNSIPPSEIPHVDENTYAPLNTSAP
jgi:hypothetical protein